MAISLQNKFLLFLALLLAVSPAYALTNASLDTFNVQDQPYTPFQVFLVMGTLGLIFFILSFLATKDQSNDAFAAMAIIPLFLSAWMAMQLDFPTRAYVLDGTTNVIWTQHNIAPSIFLAVVAFVLGVIAIAQLHRLLTTDTVENTNWQVEASDHQNSGEE